MRALFLVFVASLLSVPAAFVACSPATPETSPDPMDASANDSANDVATGGGDAGDAGDVGDASPIGPIVISASGRFAEYRVGQVELDAWNTDDMTSPAGIARMQTSTKAAYQVFEDVFDFIVFVINNTEIPPNHPTGQSLPVKNLVSGLGLSVNLDNSAAYGSAGQLQSVSALYKLSKPGSTSNPKLYSYLWLGPSMHELGHRWFNHAVGGKPHWPTYCVGSDCGAATAGIFANPANDYAEVELYLMGLIDGSSVSQPDSVALYQQIVAGEGPRNPDTSSAQKAFRGLVLVVTTAPLTTEQAQLTDDGVDKLTRTDGTVTQGCNFSRQTGGRATLQLDGLHAVKK